MKLLIAMTLTAAVVTSGALSPNAFATRRPPAQCWTRWKPLT